jgi:hypothetical protein
MSLETSVCGQVTDSGMSLRGQGVLSTSKRLAVVNTVCQAKIVMPKSAVVSC